MALSTTKAGINRTASNIVLPQTVASEVLSNVQEGSAVMQLARRQTIPGTGVKINVITGDPEPDSRSPRWYLGYTVTNYEPKE